ncbi:MAG: 50S ribosomal protein L25 [Candidatus Melainabacteria bacterium]|nr:50S ribosomal protein L25 [Candidatus Melainabacteria bacterium]
MAKQLIIKAKPRENKKPNALRASGFVPATVYGHGFHSESIQLSAKEFSKIPHKAYSHINQLEIDGKEKYPVLIRNVQTDPIKNNYFLNIEFYKIRSDEKITVKVPLNFIGHSQAVVAGGVLIVSLSELEIQCLPADIPDAIDINLDDIKEIGQAICISDLKIQEKITILTRKEEVIAKVEIPKTHEVEEKAPEIAEAAAAAPAEGTQAATAAPGKEAAPQAASKQAAAPQAKTQEVKPAKK